MKLKANEPIQREKLLVKQALIQFFSRKIKIEKKLEVKGNNRSFVSQG